LSDLSQKYELHTARTTQDIFKSAAGLKAAARDDIFKKHGLRDIKVSAVVDRHYIG